MKGPIPVRRAVERMRAYNPPLEGRTDKLRLDFNENPIGCSAAVRRALAKLSAASISAYPEQETVRRKAAKFFGVQEQELLLTNGTDEALSLVVNSFVDAEDSVLLVEPTYAMYRFYSELAGARVVALRYDAAMCFPWNHVLAALHIADIDEMPREQRHVANLGIIFISADYGNILFFSIDQQPP